MVMWTCPSNVMERPLNKNRSAVKNNARMKSSVRCFIETLENKLMKQVYRTHKLSPLPVFLTISFFVCIVLFAILQPHFSGLLFPVIRKQRFEQFLKSTKASGQIDPKAFWQFREDYSPGGFSYNGSDIEQAETQLITHLPDNGPLLRFTAPKLSSEETMVVVNTAVPIDPQLQEAFQKQLQSYSVSAVLFSSPTSIIAKTSDGKTLILFVDTIDQMRSANGLFDYLVSEQKLLANHAWVDVTTLE